MTHPFLIIWVIGFFVAFLGEAYFQGKLAEDPSLLPAFIFWFIVGPMFLCAITYDYIVEMGEKRRAKKSAKERLRVAQIQEAAELLEVSEKEVEKVLYDRHL
jgi:uncharacterized membrane protein YGL010W